ncbi:pilus motility taxis protein HmpF [Alkalinema sp. FACHB-956]|uniref:pilus motility taxis protein HmpF n=1 Tax=Alkalinema sp. FACHB-956 TaxID=2692768 RepID=UPI0016875B3C|nr:hypothetical protein [Alkalinema sp. FACHB-956]
MLYLAEVIQKKGGIMGGSKAELRLLACQRAEQNWSAVNGEEIVAAEEANRYSAGTLLLVDLTNSKQVQRIQEAGRPLVSILQNFSRLQEKFKTQEEEIEQWKQSLTYQSQELNRREMEMEARREQLEQLEEDFEQLEQQRQQFEQSRSEFEQTHQEVERQKQELEGAWEHLRGELRRLEERQQELQGASVLDEDKAQQIDQLLQQIARNRMSAQQIQEQSQQSTNQVNQHQDLLNQHWQILEQHRTSIDQLRNELNQQSQELAQRWSDWRESECSLEQAKSELKFQQATLQIKQEYAQMLGLQIQHHDDIHHQLYRMTEGIDGVNISDQVDVDALEKMPLDNLQSIVNDLQIDFDKSSEFVRGQEEELDFKQREIDALQAKVSQVSEFDRMSLEAELADERDAYQFLNETLVGQRRNLREKQGVLRQHQSILARRQGLPDPYAQEGGLNLGPVFAQIEGVRHQQSDELQKVEAQIEQIRSAIDQAQGILTGQSAELDNRRRDLEQQDQALADKRQSLGEVVGKIALYEALLQPVQDSLNGLRHKLAEMAEVAVQMQQMEDAQQQALTQVQAVFTSLQQPQLAAS